MSAGTSRRSQLVWHTDFVDTISRDIVSAASRNWRDAGISIYDSTVVLGDNNNWFAAWAPGSSSFMEPRCRILMAKQRKWEAGRELAVAAPTVEPGDFTTSGAQHNLRHLADVRQIVGRCRRSLDRHSFARRVWGTIFAPNVSNWPRRSHPTAVNVPWAQAVNKTTPKVGRGTAGSMPRLA